jgi:hypothetical protein
VPAAPARPIDPATLDGMLLHLPDAPAGARIGDDSSCAEGVSSEGGDDPYTQLASEADQAVTHCLNQPGRVVGAVSVQHVGGEPGSSCLRH